MRYTIRPLTDLTWLRPQRERRASQFTATYSDTIAMLDREIAAIGGTDVSIDVDVSPSGIRQDGQGVRCDSHVRGAATVMIKGQSVRKMAHDWQHNLRAIALTLEALRSVDRYGATETGQQYTGFKALGAGRAMPASHMTRDDAIHVLDEYTNADWSLSTDGARVFRLAQIATHPDKNGGDHAKWNRVEAAGVVLGLRR
jgi:hypothetical protein